jgi:hypothetical protein
VTGNALGQVYPAGNGGGVFNRGTLAVRDSTISANHAWEQGGGVWSSGTTSVNGSTVSGNTTGCYECASDGGGVYNSGNLTAANSTISDNTAGGGDYSPSASGGGLFTSGSVSFSNVTVAGNLVTSLCGTHCFSGPTGGGVAVAAGSASMDNSIVGANSIRQDQSPPNGGGSVTLPSACVGTIMSNGYNLVDTTAGCGFESAPTDLLDVAPQLGPLQENGGLTPTRSLAAGSPAIDAGNPSVPGSGAGACLVSDQRRVTRPQDGDGDGIARCDIGAFELQGLPPAIKEVALDVRPGSSDNRISLRSKGFVLVAILSDSSFDATTVDVASVRFGAARASSTTTTFRDVDGDRRIDVVVHVRVSATGIRAGDELACLVGITFDGAPIHGCDAITTRPRP